MSLFQDMLKSGESVFRDAVILDYDFQPKILKYRESEQQQFANAIKPLLTGRNGRNLFVYGPPGIGKTTACKHVLRELEETTPEVLPIYINCWKENTTYKIYYKICEDLGFKFLLNKKTGELFELIKNKLNKSGAVFIFDEIDKLEELDFLYTILEDIYRKVVILLTNYRDSYGEMDERIRSRLAPEFVFFRPYNEAEISGILKERRDYAFMPNCWDEDAFKELIEKCTEVQDVRVGLYLMKESGNLAEEKSLRKISLAQVAGAVKKSEDFRVKPTGGLDSELQLILEMIKNNSGKKIGELFSTYAEKGGNLSYKSFQRRILKLDEGKYIFTEKITGKEGNTTIVNYSNNKKITEF